jgi:hypothetical protein
MRICFLGSVASLALAATTIAALPSYAQSHYLRQSRPAESAETQDLNRQAADGITVRPTASEQQDYGAARSRYDAAQSQYNQQLEDYNAKNRAYQEQLRNYRDEVGANQTRDDAYAADERAPYDEANAADQRFDRLWDLDRVADPNTELYNVPVEDVDGFLTGHFRRVEIRANGDRMAVITLNSRRTIAIPLAVVRFDPERTVIVADRTSHDLDLVPSG